MVGGIFVFGPILQGNWKARMIDAICDLSNKSSAPQRTRTTATKGDGTRLSHLAALEAESIYILREAVAEFSHPVMLYSIGKDSSVMLRLAQKAFHPGKIPFPLLHIDTSYKFAEMIAFRDWYASHIAAELIVHKNQQALDDGANPYVRGAQTS